MQRLSQLGAGGRRPNAFFRLAIWLLCLVMLWPSLASAQTSTYPGCAVVNATVPYGGSVNVNLASCHNFGLGALVVPPTHGTATPGPGPVNYTPTHTMA